MPEITLVLGNKNYSSWSLRPWLVLEHLRENHGLQFREERIALFEDGFREAIRERSAAGKVPILIEGALTVHDSLAICEYLADRFPSARLWPDAVTERARGRAIAAEMHSGFPALRAQMPMNCRRRGVQVERTPELEADIARVQQIWRDCRERADGGPWLFGAFTIADAMYAPVVSRFVTYDVDCSGIVGEYRDTVLGDAAMRRWLAAAAAESEVIPPYEL